MSNIHPKKDFLLAENEAINNNTRLSDKSKRRMQRSKAENTIKAYNGDWGDFVDWCKYHGEEDLPASPETIVNYINDLADHAKANTVSRRITAISENHIMAGYVKDNPAKDNLVKTAMASIRREKGTWQKGKEPILKETLYLLSDFLDGDDIVTARDRALIYLGFAGAFRRSELVAIQIEHLKFTEDGLVVFIPSSKADQLGHGASIGIPYAPPEDASICAVRAVEHWLDMSGIKSGPLFRGFRKSSAVRLEQLSGQSVALIIKKYAKLAGLDANEFAGHSLRRGFATTAALHDVSVHGIMQQTRHKSEKMVHRYIADGKLFADNPLSRIYQD